MKIAIKILLSVCVSLFVVSCNDDVALTPKAEMKIDKTDLAINESMVINFTGVADQVVIYTGDDMHNYELREESNTGFVVNKGLFTYSYTVPGTYTVVCLASTYTDGAVDLKRDTCSFIVSVTDDQTEIEKLSCPQVLYDEVFADRLENDEWLMVLPRKVKYNDLTPVISMQQRLRFYIHSDSTKVYINDNEFVSTEKYDLSSPLNITVRSDYGTVRPYKLYTLSYPEFATFKIQGIEGTLVRNQFNYSDFEVQVTLPAGTDVTNLVPEFTTSLAADKVYIGNVEQVSGTSAVDFSQAVTYRLEALLPSDAGIKAASTVKIKISYQ